MPETQEEKVRRLKKMSHEIERLRKKEKLDVVDIHKRLSEKWPTLTSREVDEAFIWWETHRQPTSNDSGR